MTDDVTTGTVELLGATYKTHVWPVDDTRSTYEIVTHGAIHARIVDQIARLTTEQVADPRQAVAVALAAEREIAAFWAVNRMRRDSPGGSFRSQEGPFSSMVRAIEELVATVPDYVAVARVQVCGLGVELHRLTPIPPGLLDGDPDLSTQVAMAECRVCFQRPPTWVPVTDGTQGHEWCHTHRSTTGHTAFHLYAYSRNPVRVGSVSF